MIVAKSERMCTKGQRNTNPSKTSAAWARVREKTIYVSNGDQLPKENKGVD